MQRWNIPKGTRWSAVVDQLPESALEAGWLRVVGSARWVEMGPAGARSRVDRVEHLTIEGPSDALGEVLAYGWSGERGAVSGILGEAEFASAWLLVLNVENCGIFGAWSAAPDLLEDEPEGDASDAPDVPDAPEATGGWGDVITASAEATAAAEARLLARSKPAPAPTELRGYDPDGNRARRRARKQRGVRPIPGASSAPPARQPDPLPERTRKEEPQAAPAMTKGDYIDHPVFGPCRVFGEDAEGRLVIQVPKGGRKAIKLDLFEVGEPRIDGERIVYPLRRRR